MSNFSNTAKTMYLTAAITNVATTATVTNTPGGSVVNPSGYGWPSAPFYAEIDGDSAGPEIVKVTNNASGTLTIVRPSGQAWAYGSVPSAHSMNAPIVPVLTAADIADLANKSYVDSARTNLVINGNGELLDNTNFSPFTFDQSDAPTGLGAFSVSEYNTTKLSDTYIPVDTSKTYRFKYAVRQAGTAGASTLGLLSSYDIDQQWIGSEHCMFQAGTHTVLAQDLDPGDTVVHLASAANWQNAGGTATHLRGFIFWGYTNSKGYTYPDYTYSRKVLLNAYAEGAVNYGANTITLTNPWPSTWGTIPAGTKVSNSSAGNTYNYIPNTAVIPTSTYQTVYGEIGGIDTSGTNNMYRFRPGTAYVRVGWLVNLYVAGSVMKYANISLSEVSSGQLRTFEKFDTATSGIDWFQIKNTGSTPALSVDVANNRIGINKTSPSYALDVAGSALFSGKITVGSDPTGDYEVATKHYVDTYGGGGGGGSPLDPDLTAIANLVGTSGYLKKTAADTWSLDTSTFLTSNQTITLSGDASGSGTTSINVVISDDSHNHTSATISNLDAGDTTTGIFDIARIPTGTTGSTVALGNHTHSYQPADNDLTAIAALSGTGYLRRTGTDTWSLDVSPGTGNVVGPSSSTDNAIARYNGTSGTSIQDSLVTIDDTGVIAAVTFSGSGSLLTGIPQSAISNLTVDLGYKAGLASPAFTGTPTAPTAAVDTNTTQIATTEYVVAQGYLKSATAASTYQPVDGDLTAIAAVSGTGYLRRTGVDTWTLDTPATATWGGITGTLSSQTDLQNALNAKQAADNDLTAIAALTGTGFLQRTGTDTWTLATAGTGDVVGPASATDTAIALYDGTTGKLIKNSGITVSQTGTGIKFAIGDQDPGATGNNVSAPVGSLFTSTGTYEFDSGLWVKTAGTDSTGWKRVIKQYDDEVFDDYIPIFGAQGFIAQSTLKYLSDTVGNVYQLFQSGGNTLRINYPYDTGEGWGDRSNVKTGPLAIAAVYDTDRLKIYNAPPEDAGTVVFSVDEDGYTKTTRLNIAPGSAPASPQDGDMWTTSVGVYARINGVTQGPFESAAGTYQPASGDLTAIDALAGTSGFLKKTATDTWTLDTANYLPTSGGTVSGEISFSDDGEGISFYGSARIYKRVGSGITIKRHSSDVDPMVENAAGNAWYKIWHEGNDGASSGLDADTLDGSHASAFALSGHNHSGTYQPLDGDLTAIAALAGTSGFLKKTAADTWSLDTSTYLTGNQTITLSGVVTGSGTTAITTAFAAAPSFTGAVSATDGFKTTAYVGNARNPIWRFGNSDNYGISYFQGTSGIGNDTIGFHFGTATAAASVLQVNLLGNVTAAGTEEATSTVTGALRSAGGLGVAKNIYSGGTVSAATSFAITGGPSWTNDSGKWQTSGNIRMDGPGFYMVNNVASVEFGPSQDAKITRYGTGALALTGSLKATSPIIHAVGNVWHATVGSYEYAIGNITGYVLIELPAVEYAVLAPVTIKIHEYGASRYGELRAIGYNYGVGNVWTSTAATGFGTFNSSLTGVLYLYNSTTDRFALALPSATWEQLRITVDVNAAYSGRNIVESPWTISVTSDISAWTTQATATLGGLGVPTPTANGHATTKTYVDTALALKAPVANPSFTGSVSMSGTQFWMSGASDKEVKLHSASNWPYSFATASNDGRLHDSDGTDFFRMYYNGGGTAKYASILGKLSVTNAGVVNIVNSTPSTMQAMKGSVYGYASSYKALVIGETTTPNQVTIALGVDPSSNTSGAGWTGDGREILFRNAAEFMTPNAGNTAFIKPLKFDSAGKTTVLEFNAGNSNFVVDAKTSGTGVHVWPDGSLSIGADGANPTDAVRKQQLDLKANIASPTFTGTVGLPSVAGTKSVSFDQGYATFGLVTIGRSGAGYGTIGDGYRTTSSANAYNYDRGDYATQIDFASGAIAFKTSPIGTIGNPITFTTAMTILNNANVGIGISPSYKLHVKTNSDGISAGIAGSTYGIRFDNGGTYSSGMSTIHGVDSTLVGSYQPIMINGSDVRFGTSATERLRIDADGDVGINTTNPQYKLHMHGSHTTTEFLMHSIGNSTAATEADLMLWASEPQLTYHGVGIGNNVYINDSTGLARISTARAGSYIRMIDDEIRFGSVNSAGTFVQRYTFAASGTLTATAFSGGAATFTGTVTTNTITPPSGYLALNYGTGAFDAVRTGQLQVLRDGVGDWSTLFAAYGTAAEVSADTPRFIVYGIGAFEATYEGKIYGTGDSYLKIDGGAGSERQVQFQTAGSRRWVFGTTSTAESGSNAGSNFSIARYSDAGAWIDNPIEITRSTGTTTIKSIWLASGGKIENLPTPSSSSEAANKGYVDTQLALKAPIASPTFTGVVSLSGVSTPVLKFENGVSLSAKNSSGTDEQFLWPRWTDNVMYLNYGAAGWSIRNSGSTVKIFIDNAGQTTFYNSIIAPAATTSIPSIRIPHGTAPSSPTNGDIWTTTTSFMARLNGTSVNLLGTQGSTYVTIDDEQVMRVMGV